jgi:hypothetical protein
MLIVLDDAMSVSQIHPLLPADAGCRVLVTSRRSMTELAGVHLVELDPMDSGEGLELLGNMVGRPRLSRDYAAARKVVRLCDGLPLAIRAAGTMLASAHAWPLAKMAARLGGSSAFLDELSLCGFDILGNFESSCRWLAASDQGVFRLLSLLGDREFTAAWAALLLGCDPAAAQAHLARLAECHLLTMARHDASGEVCYRYHELARIYARPAWAMSWTTRRSPFPSAAGPGMVHSRRSLNRNHIWAVLPPDAVYPAGPALNLPGQRSICRGAPGRLRSSGAGRASGRAPCP